eukprot:g42895.t1
MVYANSQKPIYQNLHLPSKKKKRIVHLDQKMHLSRSDASIGLASKVHVSSFVCSGSFESENLTPVKNGVFPWKCPRKQWSTVVKKRKDCYFSEVADLKKLFNEPCSTGRGPRANKRLK